MNETIGTNQYWGRLWTLYSPAPSIALCRVPELEYASRLHVKDQRVLDHCCGDGIFASLAWPETAVYAGCDLNAAVIELARQRGQYQRLDVCDVSVKLPYEDGAFDLVFNNSGLEHVKNLAAALSEVARVLAPGGTLAFNVLNHRYFEWWPLDQNAETGYRDWQPFFHALNIEEWRSLLADAGLKITSVEGYFEKKAARTLARLDHDFSAVALAQRKIPLVSLYNKFPRLFRTYWRRRIERLTWQTVPEAGAGYFIQAIKENA